MSKQKFYPEDDINDLIEADEFEFFKLEKGRGPDKQKRKPRGSGADAERADFDRKEEAHWKAKFDAAVEADKKNNPKYHDPKHPEYKHRSGIKIR